MFGGASFDRTRTHMNMQQFKGKFSTFNRAQIEAEAEADMSTKLDFS